jgi:hypothetical protein
MGYPVLKKRGSIGALHGKYLLGIRATPQQIKVATLAYPSPSSNTNFCELSTSLCHKMMAASF